MSEGGRPGPRRRLLVRGVCAAGLLAIASGLSGCGGRQSILAPRSQQTHVISVLWWWMLGAASVVFFGAVGLLALGYLRRRSSGLPVLGEREGVVNAIVIAFGIVIPLIVLVTLFGASDIYAIRFSAAPKSGSTRMTVQVIGRQWWWEVRYPATGAVTANELHIPAGTRVQLVATTADVIHSLWVPRLARKIDMIPGRENRILLETPDVGTYLGQCSEFCGLQHAHMRLTVIAEPPGAFNSWLAAATRPSPATGGAAAGEGRALFMARGCGGCHQLRGSEARGTIGPDLTHLGSRSTLAAVSIPNTPAELAAWIRDPQAIKPGNHMPDLGLSGGESQKVAAFLEALK
ncbi:MAG TPA: cytochrome c oxidase subunit II [Solirubrobacteraceae bacterium]|nr:cytochrome c oxidase subunit II [Solirubrobacteraceae bacterium]